MMNNTNECQHEGEQPKAISVDGYFIWLCKDCGGLRGVVLERAVEWSVQKNCDHRMVWQHHLTPELLPETITSFAITECEVCKFIQRVGMCRTVIREGKPVSLSEKYIQKGTVNVSKLIKVSSVETNGRSIEGNGGLVFAPAFPCHHASRTAIPAGGWFCPDCGKVYFGCIRLPEEPSTQKETFPVGGVSALNRPLKPIHFGHPFPDEWADIRAIPTEWFDGLKESLAGLAEELRDAFRAYENTARVREILERHGYKPNAIDASVWVSGTVDRMPLVSYEDGASEVECDEGAACGPLVFGIDHLDEYLTTHHERLVIDPQIRRGLAAYLRITLAPQSRLSIEIDGVHQLFDLERVVKALEG